MSSSKVDFAHPQNGEGKLHRVSPLRREMSVGFSGRILSGLLCSPDSKRAYYPLGSSVVSRGLFGRGHQVEVAGGVHVHKVSCLHLSEKTGAVLATGEEHQVGTKVGCITAVNLTSLIITGLARNLNN